MPNVVLNEFRFIISVFVVIKKQKSAPRTVDRTVDLKTLVARVLRYVTGDFALKC